MRFGLLTTIDSPLIAPLLEHVRRLEVEDVFVICDSKLVSEKDHRIFRERVGERALEVGGTLPGLYQTGGPVVPFVFVDSHNGDFCRHVIEEVRIDCLVNAGTPRKLDSALLSAVPIGILNVHPGILPKYRGSSAVEWSIYNDDPVGNTAHFMTEEYDAGPIIRIEEYEFKQGVTYQQIRRHVYEHGCELTAHVMKDLQTGAFAPSEALIQDESGARLWPPIPEQAMQDVLQKLAKGRYESRKAN